MRRVASGGREPAQDRGRPCQAGRRHGLRAHLCRRGWPCRAGRRRGHRAHLRRRGSVGPWGGSAWRMRWQPRRGGHRPRRGSGRERDTRRGAAAGAARRGLRGRVGRPGAALAARSTDGARRGGRGVHGRRSAGALAGALAGAQVGARGAGRQGQVVIAAPDLADIVSVLARDRGGAVLSALRCASAGAFERGLAARLGAAIAGAGAAGLAGRRRLWLQRIAVAHHHNIPGVGS
mmetsp:Transcript_115645/g.334081  ORF Transcript_115645/g.334081 Transcript_115645/m.334081 type:complete len:234 (+) Transcript_115645:390-1091(+)